MVQYCHSSGPNFRDQDGCLPLKNASMGDHLKAIQVLPEKGADVNITNKYGVTPLMRAATENQLQVCRYLLENGTKVNVQVWHERTALMEASFKWNLDIMKALIDRGESQCQWSEQSQGESALIKVQFFFSRILKNNPS